ncbi:MAG: metal ABC transporter substrate-binding protein [Aeromicrobium erythreum]
MKRSVVALATAALLPLAACGSPGADDGKVKVLAAFYPWQFVAERVGGDDVDVENLTPPGGEPHDLELKPRQVADVQDAEVLIYETGLQASVDEAVKQADRSSGTVDVAKVVPLRTVAEDDHDAEKAEEHDHGHEEGDEDGHSHGHDHGHDHGGKDPHVWLDPVRMKTITGAVRDALVKADPDNAASYRANATKLEAELTQLDEDFRTGLKQCKLRTIVTAHDAFGYLGARYDLEQVSIAGIDPSNEPSAAQIAALSKLVKSKGITTVFTEELVSPAVARTVADEAGVRTATLDPIEGLSDQTSDQNYLTLMRANLDAIRKADDCS